MRNCYFIVLMMGILCFVGCTAEKTTPILTQSQVCNGVESVGVWISSVKVGETNELAFTPQEVKEAVQNAMNISKCFKEGSEYALDITFGSLAGVYSDGSFIRGERANYGVVEVRLRFYNVLRERIYTGKSLVENLQGQVLGMGGTPEFHAKDRQLALQNAIQAAIGEAWGKSIP